MQATSQATSTSSSAGAGCPGTRRSARFRLRLLAPLAAGGLLATACTGGDPSAGEETLSPFTGLPADPAPVLTVKIDNHREARPHTGVEDADIVAVEKVEGGLSRLHAVYSSKLPDSVGPVRSAREYNVEQLRTFGEPALAYSGARTGVLDLIEASPLHGVPPDDAPGAYHRGGDTAAPHNLYVRPGAALDAAPDAGESKDIGFHFGAGPDGGVQTEQRTVDHGTSRTGFTWSAEEERWLASFDGEPAESSDGERLGGKTVIIQKTDMPPDSSGKSPYIETVGSGEATVLRDGEAFETTWKRTGEDAGTTFTLPNGERMPFAPGQVWLVYEEN